MVAAQRFIPMFVNRDADMVDAAQEKDALPIGAALAAVFVALVRAKVPPEQLAQAAAEERLLDADDEKIPAWIVEASFRSALGEPGIMEGITPDLLLETRVAYILRKVNDLSQAERDAVVQAAVAVLEEAREASEDTGNDPTDGQPEATRRAR